MLHEINIILYIYTRKYFLTWTFEVFLKYCYNTTATERGLKSYIKTIKNDYSKNDK